MADPRWIWDGKSKRYRDETTGRYLAKSTVQGIRDRVTTEAGIQARELGGQVVRGEITIADFRQQMRDLIRNVHVAEYVFGRGGLNAMTPSDFGRIGGDLAGQYRFLDGFVRDLELGALSEAQAGARAAQYMNAGHRAYEQGHASAWDVESHLPVYPGEDCLGFYFCHCFWDFHSTDTSVEATWTLGSNENHCPVCVEHARAWNPLVIAKDNLGRDRQPVRLRALPLLARAG